MTKLRLIAMQEEHKHKISQGRNIIFKNLNNSAPQNNADIISGSLTSDTGTLQSDQNTQTIDMERNAVNLNANPVSNEVTTAIFGTSMSSNDTSSVLGENPTLTGEAKNEELEAPQQDLSQNDILANNPLDVPWKEPVMDNSNYNNTMDFAIDDELKKFIKEELTNKFIKSFEQFIPSVVDEVLPTVFEEIQKRNSGASLVTTINNVEPTVGNEVSEDVTLASENSGIVTNPVFDPQATMVVPVADINAAREIAENGGYKNVA